jgi:hypothetical protein
VWKVYLEGSVVIVQTRTEAQLLGAICVENSKLNAGTSDPPDSILVQKILKVCEDYGYTSIGERRLRRWLTAKGTKGSLQNRELSQIRHLARKRPSVK